MAQEITILPIDRSTLGGGLARMVDRFHNEGSLTGDHDTDAFLRQHPNAALLGLLYDQRIRAEVAFTGPVRLAQRLGHLDMRRIAAMDLDTLRVSFAQQPAVHRFSNKMAEFTLSVAAMIAEKYEGDAANLWNDGASSTVIAKRLRALPGFGLGKSAKMKFVLHYLGYRDFSNE